ncbi:hypothetical protein [Streptomyces sp. NPDC021224]|uniref:hypothetical protein n=1 Tax=unclassified Streptomyces TaxID=2593676 RepID=UPI00378D1AA0
MIGVDLFIALTIYVGMAGLVSGILAMAAPKDVSMCNRLAGGLRAGVVLFLIPIVLILLMAIFSAN